MAGNPDGYIERCRGHAFALFRVDLTSSQARRHGRVLPGALGQALHRAHLDVLPRARTQLHLPRGLLRRGRRDAHRVPPNAEAVAALVCGSLAIGRGAEFFSFGLAIAPFNLIGHPGELVEVVNARSELLARPTRCTAQSVIATLPLELLPGHARRERPWPSAGRGEVVVQGIAHERVSDRRRPVAVRKIAGARHQVGGCSCEGRVTRRRHDRGRQDSCLRVRTDASTGVTNVAVRMCGVISYVKRPPIIPEVICANPANQCLQESSAKSPSLR